MTGAETHAIAIRDLTFRFEAGAPALLNIPRLEVPRGERVLLQGASGSGKTTLLGLIAGVLSAPAGSICLLGEDLSALSSARRDKFRADHVGYVFQQFNLVPYLSARENIALALSFSPRRRMVLEEQGRAAASEVTRLATGLGLDETLLARRPEALSVGQQQRVAAARALIGAPEILLADEPTSALDQDLRREFLSLLFAECAAAGTAVLFVSHESDIGDQFDRVMRLDREGGVRE